MRAPQARSRRIPKAARVLTERGVMTPADITLAALLAAEHGRRHPPGAEPKCPRCRER